MQWLKLICVTLAGFWLGLATVVMAPRAALAQAPEGAQKLDQCERYMAAYARSASRKLGRALSGQKYQLEALPNRSAIELSIADEPRQFEVLYEHDKTVAGLVDKSREHRVSYIIARTSLGPVITEHRWPAQSATASNDKACKPVSSTIVVPEVPVAPVDVDPFKFWGLRVVWHLPRDLAENNSDADPFAVLRSVIAGGSDEDGKDVTSGQPPE